MPSVKFGSIGDDLYRRDFTINAMAVSIDKKNFGELIDHFGGRRDLKSKRIRVLHDRSFIDDPTRIFRAVRFEQRYNFKIDRHTELLIKNAVKSEMFEKVSGERLREEIGLLLGERDPLKAIKRMRSLHELRFISPKIRFDSGSEKIYKDARKLYRQYKKYFSQEPEPQLWLVSFMAVIDKLSAGESLDVCRRFMMSRSDRLKIMSCKEYGKSIIGVLSDARPMKASRIYKALEPLSREAVIFLVAKCGSRPAKKRAANFFGKHKGVRLKIKGSDLKKLGLRPGPVFARILKKTLYAKIDGSIRTKKDELLFAGRLAKKI